MRILFDQGAPVPLRTLLTRHHVSTVHELGWSQLSNGDLLKRAEDEGYDILVTTDQNLRYQQNLPNRKLAIAVLKSTSWPRIRAHGPHVVARIEGLQTGGYAEIDIP